MTKHPYLMRWECKCLVTSGKPKMGKEVERGWSWEGLNEDYSLCSPPVMATHLSLKAELSWRENLAIDQNHFLYQAVNMFNSAVKLAILTWGVYGDWLPFRASLKWPLKLLFFWHCIFQHQRLSLGLQYTDTLYIHDVPLPGLLRCR